MEEDFCGRKCVWSPAMSGDVKKVLIKHAEKIEKGTSKRIGPIYDHLTFKCMKPGKYDLCDSQKQEAIRKCVKGEVPAVMMKGGASLLSDCDVAVSYIVKNAPEIKKDMLYIARKYCK
jgi:hypothetical protein